LPTFEETTSRDPEEVSAVHVQDLEPSPDPGFTDRSRCEQPVLTTQRIHDIVKQVTLDISGIPARGFTSRLEALIDELVSSLVPLMAAEESVLCDHVDHALGDALRQDHREVRGLVERLSMLSAGLDRRSLGATKKEPVLLAALQKMTIALGRLRTHELATMRHLDEALTTPKEWARLAATLDAAAVDAREHTMLIVRPAIPPTDAHVLRNRPDLTSAYAVSLAEIERQSHRSA
jgi:PhoPQ-activated pathogenicity-related protein